MSTTHTPSKDSDLIEILLVEDNPADVRLAEEIFLECGIKNNLNVARDGDEALRRLRRQGEYAHVRQPDLVLLDLNLPRKHGSEVLREMKDDPALRVIPVVILTTSRNEQDILESYNHHANCYILKPMDLDQFVKVVRHIESFWLEIARLPKKAI